MTRIERYENQLANLEAKRGELLRSHQYVKAMRLNSQIDEARKLLAELKSYYEPRPLSESVSSQELKEMNIVPLMLTCHLAADFLTEVCYQIIDICNKHGFERVSFVPEIKDILKHTDKFAGMLTGISPQLESLMLRNETFNASLLKKYLNYIETRMKHYKKETK